MQGNAVELIELKDIHKTYLLGDEIEVPVLKGISLSVASGELVALMGGELKLGKILYPANRWRDSNDYMVMAVKKPQDCFLAPDGVTIIPAVFDLIRSNSLLEARPGQPFYATDEYYKRTVRFSVSAEGYLSDAKVFAERGEYNVAVDGAGNVYVPEGDIAVFDKEGKALKEIAVPERPACVIFGGADGKTLFITARSSLYAVRP